MKREPSLVKLYDQLRAEIARHPSGVTAEELQQLLPDLSARALRIGLQDLCTGILKRDERGRYRDATRAELQAADQGGPRRAKVLALITARPGISMEELRAALPACSVSQLRNAVAALRQIGAIENAGYGRYRVPSRQQSTAGAGQTAPLARLMAGR